jgi:hypothetical protein
VYNRIQRQLLSLIDNSLYLGSNERTAYRNGVLACESILEDCYQKNYFYDIKDKFYRKLKTNGSCIEEYNRGIKDCVNVVSKYL